MRMIKIITETPLKLGKAGRPTEWIGLDLTKEQIKTVLVDNWIDDPEVHQKWEELGLTRDRFRLPDWAEMENGRVVHKKTREVYLWCLGIEANQPVVKAGNKDITDVSRLEKLLGRPLHTEVTPYSMSFLIRRDSIKGQVA